MTSPKNLRRCLTCDRGFLSRSGRYCSLPCRPHDVRGRLRREARLIARAEREAIAQKRRIEREAQRLTDEAARHRRCVYCDVAIDVARRTTRFCSTLCRTRSHRPPHGPLTLDCVVCHEGFESIEPHARYCSDRCRRKVARKAVGELARRRAAKKIRAMRPRLIERWGMVCYLCGGSIDFGPNVVHPRAFTLDHVWPVTAGGRDTEDNLRPAHRACNEDKGERLPAWWELRQAHIA